MISFQPMQDYEFTLYSDYFVSDYAREIAANYNTSFPEAVRQAQKTIESSFPHRVKTQEQTLLCIVKSGEHIGYLWYRPDHKNLSVFIYDFHILPAHQGQNYGKHALQKLEEILKKQGFKKIKLRVARDNLRAQHVYEKSGFHVTGINMNKNIC